MWLRQAGDIRRLATPEGEATARGPEGRGYRNRYTFGGILNSGCIGEQ
jgi:hypothetical protein